jgi:signal transduction histidine kinase
VGAIGIYWARTHRPAAETLELLVTLASAASIALENVRFYTELERQVADRTAELSQARDRAEAADHLKSAFLATMSHELRTPLNSVIGFTGILLQRLAGPLTAEQHKQLGMVQGSARHLLALINDVLDLSKIEAGELAVRQEPVDVGATVEAAATAVRPLAAAKNLQLDVAADLGVGVVVSDGRRVHQILLNLLNNAVKFTAVGGVTVTATRDASSVRVEVADTGPGIRPEDLERLFRPFQQLDAGLARHHEGTGLGLAICQRLAGLLGGAVRVDSTWGVGSRFVLELPTSLVEARSGVEPLPDRFEQQPG